MSFGSNFRKGFLALRSQNLRDALIFVVKDRHAIETLKTLRILDATVGFDRIVVAANLAQLAGRSAFVTSCNPRAPAYEPANGHNRAKWTQIAAKAFEQDRGYKQQSDSIGYIVKFTHKECSDSGFERFHFDCGIQPLWRGENDCDQCGKNEIFQSFEPRIPSLAWLDLGQTQSASNVVKEFLHRAKWAKPTAKVSAPPKHKTQQGEAP